MHPAVVQVGRPHKDAHLLESDQQRGHVDEGVVVRLEDERRVVRRHRVLQDEVRLVQDALVVGRLRRVHYVAERVHLRLVLF